MTRAVLNVAAYRFVPLADTASLRERVLARAADAGLKGTVLLADEGLNLTLAGQPTRLRDFLSWLMRDERFAGLPVQESFSESVPFRRLVVEVRREIIRMDCPAIRPALGRAPAVDATTLARWLQAGRCDEGRPVVLLDIRNAFEVDAGAFDGAIDWRLNRFGEFPAAVEAHRHEFEGQTVVTYCTGGIRCEKAALVLQRAGIAHVRQLDGGILKYFELTDGAPGWHGGCFVFDERGVLAPTLIADAP